MKTQNLLTMSGTSKLLGLERVTPTWAGHYFHEEVGNGVHTTGHGVPRGDPGIHHRVYKGLRYGVFWEIIGGR